MKDLIVNSLELFSKIAIVTMVVGAFFGGLAFGSLWSALIAAGAAFFAAVTLFGGVFILLEMNDHLRAIRRTLEASQPVIVPSPQVGPHA